MKNRIQKEILYKHDDGKSLKGIRVIEGTNKIRQVVVYEGKYLSDNETYAKGQEQLMEAAAQQIMFEFAMGRMLSARQYNEKIKI